jgi:hypothetical protein
MIAEVVELPARRCTKPLVVAVRSVGVGAGVGDVAGVALGVGEGVGDLVKLGVA